MRTHRIQPARPSVAVASWARVRAPRPVFRGWCSGFGGSDSRAACRSSTSVIEKSPDRSLFFFTDHRPPNPEHRRAGARTLRLRARLLAVTAIVNRGVDRRREPDRGGGGQRRFRHARPTGQRSALRVRGHGGVATLARGDLARWMVGRGDSARRDGGGERLHGGRPDPALEAATAPARRTRRIESRDPRPDRAVDPSVGLHPPGRGTSGSSSASRETP